MEAPKRIVYLGTKPIGARCFEYLLEKQEELNFVVIAAGTQERKEFGASASVADLAEKCGIPLIAGPDELPDCDIIYSVQYHKILKERHINKAKQIAVNLHLAPLPDYRGCNQFSFAIFNGAVTFGVTIHEIDTGVDSGDILFEERFPLPDDIWVKDLFDRTVGKGQELFEQTLSAVIKGHYTRTPQSELVPERGMQLYNRKDISWLKQLSLEEPAFKTARRIRATYMPGFEPPYFTIGDKKMFITTED